MELEIIIKKHNIDISINVLISLNKRLWWTVIKGREAELTVVNVVRIIILK